MSLKNIKIDWVAFSNEKINKYLICFQTCLIFSSVSPSGGCIVFCESDGLPVFTETSCDNLSPVCEHDVSEACSNGS